ncbi:hypothetical protein KC323_g235 [Hortaea werneckii]|nr:hypothetical protein KC323_g235 [Hortaea werneckii]
MPSDRGTSPYTQIPKTSISSRRHSEPATAGWGSHHLRNAGDVVVATADEANKRFPGILLQYPYAGELGRFLGKVGIGCGPLFVELREVRSEVKVMLDQFEGIGEDAIVKGHGPDAGVILAPSEGLAAAEGGVDAEFGE